MEEHFRGTAFSVTPWPAPNAAAVETVRFPYAGLSMRGGRTYDLGEAHIVVPRRGGDPAPHRRSTRNVEH